MNYVVITFANGKKKSYCYFSDDAYAKGIKAGWITGSRPVTEFELKLQRFLDKFKRK